DTETNAWLINYGRCIGCRECAYACPFGAINLNMVAMPIKCDLCGGDPECVKVCPHDALIFGEEDEVIRELQRRKSVGIAYSLYREGSQSLPGNRVKEAEEAVTTLRRIWERNKSLNI
ncbi:MAG: 4Fe-4S binding protein, partial [Desulfurococcales archaeon]|nr:4Fe-4S binding protein [Desulfurococcales archaeon]